MVQGLKRPVAARFAFLMSVPIMLAAGLLATKDLFEIPQFAELLPVFLPGLLASAIVSYLSIRWLLGYLTRRPLYIFAVYCGILGSVVLIISLMR
jgi:undecaprenyl-diphosphatase